MGKIKLIINADDFGLCDDVNKSIIECYNKGNLTSTTLMVNMPGTLNAVELAYQNPDLGIGLHFTLTEGSPLTNNKSLINEDGNFLSRSELLKKLIFNRIDLSEVRLEFKAQLDKALSFDIKITHIDSHQHVHLIPSIFKSILPYIKSKNLPVRNAYTYVNKGLLYKSPLKFIKQSLLKNSIHGLRKEYSFSPDYMFSLYDFPEIEKDNNLYDNMLIEFSKKIKEHSVIELIVHPYNQSSQLNYLYPNDFEERNTFFENCYAEYSILNNEKLTWQNKDITLINFAQIN